jgi:hypothetical protein
VARHLYIIRGNPGFYTRSIPSFGLSQINRDHSTLPQSGRHCVKQRSRFEWVTDNANLVQQKSKLLPHPAAWA